MKSLYEHITSVLNESLILEKFVTIFSSDSKDEQLKYAKIAWPLIDNAYKYCGGLAGIKTYDAFVDEFVYNEEDEFIWKMVRRGSKISAVVIYKNKNKHRKTVAMACDPSEQGKKDLNMIISEDMKIKERGAWAEVSGKSLGTYLNMGAVVLPNSIASELLPGKVIEPLDDGYFYKRPIKGEMHVKLIIGYPPNDYEGDKPSDELIKTIKTLGKKYEAEL